jgi:hypothetical protein
MNLANHYKTLSLLAGALLVAGVFLIPRTASANVGGDLDLTFPLDSHASNGWGFSLRLGQELHLPLVALTPEIGFSYYDFGGDFGNKIYEGIAGARLGFGEVLRPGVFAHVGVGDSVPAFADHHLGFGLDGGVFLDFTLLPILNIGIHGAYNRLSVGDVSGDSSKWFTVGVHADLVF